MSNRDTDPHEVFRRHVVAEQEASEKGCLNAVGLLGIGFIPAIMGSGLMISDGLSKNLPLGDTLIHSFEVGFAMWAITEAVVLGAVVYKKIDNGRKVAKASRKLEEEMAEQEIIEASKNARKRARGRNYREEFNRDTALENDYVKRMEEAMKKAKEMGPIIKPGGRK